MNDLRNYADRLFNRYEIDNNGCWYWIGARNNGGYGMVAKTFAGVQKNQLAHRVMYTLFYGAIPDNKVVDHICNTPACVNPRHLQCISQDANMARSLTAATAVNRRKRYCKHGHEYTIENTYNRQREGRKPERDCRTCMKIRNDARKNKVI